MRLVFGRRTMHETTSLGASKTKRVRAAAKKRTESITGYGKVMRQMANNGAIYASTQISGCSHQPEPSHGGMMAVVTVTATVLVVVAE